MEDYDLHLGLIWNVIIKMAMNSLVIQLYLFVSPLFIYNAKFDSWALETSGWMFIDRRSPFPLLRFRQQIFSLNFETCITSNFIPLCCHVFYDFVPVFIFLLVIWKLERGFSQKFNGIKWMVLTGEKVVTIQVMIEACTRF